MRKKIPETSLYRNFMRRMTEIITGTLVWEREGRDGT